jgi:HPt (histidine-containing phosphotransfer) domain-containing protein
MGQVQPVKPAAPASFDARLALERCFDNPQMLADMVRCFLAEGDAVLPQMRTALAQHDFKTVGCLGHRLKGTLVYLGMESAIDAARRVEEFDYSAGDATEAAEAIEALERQCEALKRTLSAHWLATAPALPTQSETDGN